MKIYAKIGESEQVIDSRKKPKRPAGYIEMKEVRPDGDYIASSTGEWVEGVPPEKEE